MVITMTTAFEAYFNSIQEKKIAVLGLGVSNRPLVRLLLEHGCSVIGCDKTPREKLEDEVLELEKLGCQLHLGEGYLDDIDADVVFRTPDADLDAKFVAEAEKNGRARAALLQSSSPSASTSSCRTRRGAMRI